MKIAVENGCFGYRKGEQLLQNVSLEASDGELVAILGPNGAGKTTMLRCMMGFLHWKSGRSAERISAVFPNGNCGVQLLMFHRLRIPQPPIQPGKWCCLGAAAGSAFFPSRGQGMSRWRTR